MTTVRDFDLSVDLLGSIIWQYDSSPAMRALAEAKQTYYDGALSQFWLDWYRDVYNIDTANDFGLGVWARILDLPLAVVATPTNEDHDTFGFASDSANFGNSNFGRMREGEVTLTREQKRLVVRLRYFALTHTPTLDNVNEFLKRYFWQDQSKVFVLESNDMTLLTYVFGHEPGSQLRFVLEKYDLLPRPATVGTMYVVLPREAWGVGEHRLNFRDDANFGKD